MPDSVGLCQLWGCPEQSLTLQRVVGVLQVLTARLAGLVSGEALKQGSTKAQPPHPTGLPWARKR